MGSGCGVRSADGFVFGRVRTGTGTEVRGGAKLGEGVIGFGSMITAGFLGTGISFSSFRTGLGVAGGVLLGGSTISTRLSSSFAWLGLIACGVGSVSTRFENTGAGGAAFLSASEIGAACAKIPPADSSNSVSNNKPRPAKTAFWCAFTRPLSPMFLFPNAQWFGLQLDNVEQVVDSTINISAVSADDHDKLPKP